MLTLTLTRTLTLILALTLALTLTLTLTPTPTLTLTRCPPSLGRAAATPPHSGVLAETEAVGQQPPVGRSTADGQPPPSVAAVGAGAVRLLQPPGRAATAATAARAVAARDRRQQLGRQPVREAAAAAASVSAFALFCKDYREQVAAEVGSASTLALPSPSPYP